jgi:hypothetical protein
MRAKNLVTAGLAATLTCALVSGCDDKPAAPTAPSASALSRSAAAAGASSFTVDKANSKVDFMMEAPKEKIRGRVVNAAEGELSIDPSDITKATGNVIVDISGIELYQTRADDSGSFGTEEKSDLQNTHARAWLEISDDAPAEMKKKNARVEFAIRSIEGASQKNVQSMTGSDRKVTFKATGDFLLHGHKTQKTAELEATFHYDGDKPVSVAIKTTKPFGVGLAEHDVRPREAFGKLAQKGLDVLAPKVAKEALVSFELTAVSAGGAKAAGAPAGSASASAK